MNCIQPTAPAALTMRWRPHALSISLIAGRNSQPAQYWVPAAWQIGSRKGGVRNLSVKNVGTTMGAAPGSAGESVGFARVGVPSAACVGSADSRLRFAFSRSRFVVFLTRPESDPVFGVEAFGDFVL